MSYQALYRKFRPECFDDVKGQEAIVRTLENQIRTGRIGHAYLFCGTRGTGKTTVAKIFARAVNCENPNPDGSPCGQCAICKGISDGTLMNVIEIDAASNNGVDNVRTIIDEVSYSPAQGKYKVYIIDEVHMLSTGAFNALLKTLEEPPAYAIFILATTEVNKVPVTILSRCQRYDFHRMTIDTLVARMKELIAVEGNDVEDRALMFIAKCADGSMRDALSLLDQCLAFNYGEPLTYDKALDVLGAVDNSVYASFLEFIIGGNLTAAIEILNDHIMQGREISAFVSDFIRYLRNLLLVGTTAEGVEDVIDVSSDTLETLKKETKLIDTDTLMRYIRIFSELSGEIRFSTQKRVLTEIAIVKLMRPQMEEDILSMKNRMMIVEKKVDKIEHEGVRSEVRMSDTEPDPGEKMIPTAKLPEALPEDIKMVSNNWNRIVKDSGPMVKTLLAKSRVTVDVRTGKLVIMPDNLMNGEILNRETNRKEISDIIAREIRKNVEFSIYTPEKNDAAALADLSEVVKKAVDFPIETVEDDENDKEDDY